MAAGIPTLRNTTIFLKCGASRLLILQNAYNGKWMSPGGEIDGTDNGHAGYADQSFEGALVREVLEESGLPEFPNVRNAIFYDYGKNGPHTRVFIAETDDRLHDFHYQPSEVKNHKFELISNLTQGFVWNGKKKKEDRKDRKHLRNKKTFELLTDPYWATKYPSSLASFAGASLYTDGKGNRVVRKGEIPPTGFWKGAKWSQKPQGQNQPLKYTEGWWKLKISEHPNQANQANPAFFAN